MNTDDLIASTLASPAVTDDERIDIQLARADLAMLCLRILKRERQGIARLAEDIRTDRYSRRHGRLLAIVPPLVVSEETDDAREVQVAVAARRHGLVDPTEGAA